MIFEDEQIKARESIVRVEDAQLGEVGMQNVVGKLSRTPGWIEHAGPALGEHNREILIEQLGYSEAQLREFGITV
ncbi:formyl-coenzyme A transferase [compost metagenome]